MADLTSRLRPTPTPGPNVTDVRSTDAAALRVRLARRPSVILLTITALLAVMVTSADAQPSSDEARSALEQARDRLDELEGQFNAVVDEYNEAQERYEEAQGQVRAARAELQALQRDSDALQGQTAAHIRQLHKFGPTVEFTTLLTVTEPGDAGARAAALRRVLSGQQADMQSLAATQTSLHAAQERLKEEEARAASLAEEAEEKRDQIEVTVAEQAAEVERNERVLAQAIEREEAERRAREEAAARAAAQRRQQERARQQAAAQRTSSSGSAAGSSSTSTSTSSPSPAPAARANAQVAVDAALAQLGKPYRWGATGPNAFDCSGLMVYAWRQAGVTLPRTSHAQFTNLRSISRSELRPGDLVFAGSPRVHHVGMYIGNGQIVHSPRAGRPVEVRSMDRRDLRGFARVTG